MKLEILLIFHILSLIFIRAAFVMNDCCPPCDNYVGLKFGTCNDCNKVKFLAEGATLNLTAEPCKGQQYARESIFSWKTPFSGQSENSTLLIHNITEFDSGEYECISPDKRSVAIKQVKVCGKEYKLKRPNLTCVSTNKNPWLYELRCFWNASNVADGCGIHYRNSTYIVGNRKEKVTTLEDPSCTTSCSALWSNYHPHRRNINGIYEESVYTKFRLFIIGTSAVQEPMTYEFPFNKLLEIYKPSVRPVVQKGTGPGCISVSIACPVCRQSTKFLSLKYRLVNLNSGQSFDKDATVLARRPHKHYRTNYQIRDLVPFTEYNIILLYRLKKAGLWSDLFSYTARSSSSIPNVVVNESQIVTAVNPESGNLLITFPKVQTNMEYGPGFYYFVCLREMNKDQPNCVNTTRNVADISVNSETVQITVVAGNSLGLSGRSSSVTVSRLQLPNFKIASIVTKGNTGNEFDTKLQLCWNGTQDFTNYRLAICDTDDWLDCQNPLISTYNKDQNFSHVTITLDKTKRSPRLLAFNKCWPYGCLTATILKFGKCKNARIELEQTAGADSLLNVIWTAPCYEFFQYKVHINNSVKSFTVEQTLLADCIFDHPVHCPSLTALASESSVYVSATRVLDGFTIATPYYTLQCDPEGSPTATSTIILICLMIIPAIVIGLLYSQKRWVIRKCRSQKTGEEISLESMSLYNEISPTSTPPPLPSPDTIPNCIPLQGNLDYEEPDEPNLNIEQLIEALGQEAEGSGDNQVYFQRTPQSYSPNHSIASSVESIYRLSIQDISSDTEESESCMVPLQDSVPSVNKSTVEQPEQAYYPPTFVPTITAFGQNASGLANNLVYLQRTSPSRSLDHSIVSSAESINRSSIQDISSDTEESNKILLQDSMPLVNKSTKQQEPTYCPHTLVPSIMDC